jgi:hypothetical protein
MGYLPYFDTVAVAVGRLRAAVDDPAEAIDALATQLR